MTETVWKVQPLSGRNGYAFLPKAAATSSLVRVPSSDHERSRASVTFPAATTPAIAADFQSSTPKIAPPATAASADEPNTPKIRRMSVCTLIIMGSPTG